MTQITVNSVTNYLGYVLQKNQIYTLNSKIFYGMILFAHKFNLLKLCISNYFNLYEYIFLVLI